MVSTDGLVEPSSGKTGMSTMTNIKYFLTTTDSRGCFGVDSVEVVTFVPPVVNADPDKQTCIGTPILIGCNPTSGTPPYTYHWSPLNGLSSTTEQIVTANPAITTKYTVNVKDSKGCENFKIITVTVLPLPTPTISAAGPTSFCSCDSVKLVPDKAYTGYHWSTGETTQNIYAHNPGLYNLTVTDENGCSNTTSDIEINVIYPTTIASIGDTAVWAASGETFSVPLFIKSSSDLDTCKARNFTAQIGFNKTVMVPTGNTPKGIIDNEFRIITVKGQRMLLDTVLADLKFMATLGNSVSTPVTLLSFEWDECPFAVQSHNSYVNLSDICYEGGKARLFLGSIEPLKVILRPNPATDRSEVGMDVIMKTKVKLEIKDLLGRTIIKITDADYGIGNFNFPLDLTSMSSGVYVLFIETPYSSSTQILEVGK